MQDDLRRVSQTSRLRLNFGLTKLKDEKALTERQETIIQIALEKGYFDFPERIALRELAKSLGISAATLTETLRRAQKRLLTEHFRGRASVLARQLVVGS